MNCGLVSLSAEIASRDDVGGKARRLGELLARGLPVPPGFVITHSVFASVASAEGRGPSARISELARFADKLAAVSGAAPAFLSPEIVSAIETRAVPLFPLMVRSSVSMEDGVTGAAPGLFATVAVDQPADLWAGICAVWLSALTPIAAAYAQPLRQVRSDHPEDANSDLAIAVIIQRRVLGSRRVVYTRPPGRPDASEMLIAGIGEQATTCPRPPALVTSDGAPTTIALALAAEQAIGAVHGADVELVEDAATQKVWLVQARPVVHPARRRQIPPPPSLVAPLMATGKRWTFDVCHNPDPLSVAQRELAAAVDAAAASPARLCTVAGYLYVQESAPPPEIGSATELEQRAGLAAANVALQLAKLTACEKACASAHDLLKVVDAYVEVVRAWACELAPLVAGARHAARALAAAAVGIEQAPRLLVELTARPPSALAAALRDVARGRVGAEGQLLKFADLSPAWDVAAATLGEDPQRWLRAAELATACVRGDAPPRTSQLSDRLDEPLRQLLASLCSAIADWAERDDLLFAHAQASVRRVLLRIGSQTGLGEDVFWIPFSALTSSGIDTLRRQAAAARSANERARTWRMPLHVGTGVVEPEPIADVWHGAGGGGLVVGSVVRIERLDDTLPNVLDRIVVMPAITPALAVALVGARAIVSATGGLLDHGAAMARELNLPYVVGCIGPWQQLTDAEVIEVDGDAGVVRRLPGLER